MEFEEALEANIMYKDKLYCDDDSIFSLDMGDLILWLSNDAEFMKNPSMVTLKKSMHKYKAYLDVVFRDDFKFMSETILPYMVKRYFSKGRNENAKRKD